MSKISLDEACIAKLGKGPGVRQSVQDSINVFSVECFIHMLSTRAGL
jgi:hypothetical protein